MAHQNNTSLTLEEAFKVGMRCSNWHIEIYSEKYVQHISLVGDNEWVKEIYLEYRGSF